MGFGNVGLILSLRTELGPERLPAWEAQLSLPDADVSISSSERLAGTGGSIHFFQSTISTTAEDEFERNTGLERDGVRIVADVRLDNRSALGAQLHIDASTFSDEALLVLAYRRWGRDMSSRLRGDFAFIIWDRERQLVLACRDPLGVRLLAFARESDRIVIASTVGGVRAALERQPRPNLDYLRKFIDGSDDWTPTPTAYDSIFRLAPGHQLEIEREAVVVVRYDELKGKPWRGGKPDDVFTEFEHRFRTAVESRLRSSRPIGFSVSGGFDSSSILCVAHEAVEAGRCLQPLRSYSAVFSRFEEADDGPYRSAVLAKCPLVAATLLPWDDRPWSVATMDGRDGFPLDEPTRGARSFPEPLSRQAKQDGCRVLVRGVWGDQLMIGGAYDLGRMLWDLPLRRMIREAPRFLNWAGPARLLRSAVPGAALRLRRLAAAMRLAAPPIRAAGEVLGRDFVHGTQAGRIVHAARSAKWVGVEHRFPFLDRDLHEFVMSLPAEYFFEDGKWKRLLRIGLRHVLPPAFQDRRHFAHAGRFVFTAMKADRTEITAYLRTPLVVEYGLSSALTVRRVLQALDSDAVSGPTQLIRRLLAVEIWLRDQAGVRTNIPSVAMRSQNATKSAQTTSGPAS